MDDWRTLDGPRFFRLAVRLTAYTGVLQARALEERERSEGRGSTSPGRAPDGPRHVDADVARTMLLT